MHGDAVELFAIGIPSVAISSSSRTHHFRLPSVCMFLHVWKVAAWGCSLSMNTRKSILWRARSYPEIKWGYEIGLQSNAYISFCLDMTLNIPSQSVRERASKDRTLPRHIVPLVHTLSINHHERKTDWITTEASNELNLWMGLMP